MFLKWVGEIWEIFALLFAISRRRALSSKERIRNKEGFD
jgi:hypothetical protein